MWFTTTAIGGGVLLYGGFDNDDDRSQGDAWFSEDLVDWHRVEMRNSPRARHAHAAVNHRGSLYLIGGNTDYSKRSDVWRLSLPPLNFGKDYWSWLPRGASHRDFLWGKFALQGVEDKTL